MRHKGRAGRKIGLKQKNEKVFGPRGYAERIISSMTDPLITVDPDAMLRSINKAALDLLGYKQEELVGQPVKKIFLQEGRREEESALNRYFRKIMDSGAAYNTGLIFLTKQGKEIPVNFSGGVMQQGGRIIGMVGVARDMRQIMAVISDLEKKGRDLGERSKNLTRMQRGMLHMMGDLEIAKKEAEKAEEELKRLDQLKRDFIATVSHELRTPLAITKEGISLILDRITGVINEEQEKILGTAGSNIDRLARIIDGLLNVSKIEAGKVSLRRRSVEITGLIRQVAADFELHLKAKNLELRINVPKNRLDVFVDPDKLVQVFINLLGNALKFTRRGHIEISLQEKESEIECVVADTGVGISEEDLPKVFSKFEQFGRLPGPGEKGTGLGLAITKGIIELHGGKIWVESKLGLGAKFSFVLPHYTSEAIFKECLRNAMREAMDKRVRMALMVVSILGFDKTMRGLSDERRGSFLRGVEGVIKNALRRDGDVVLTGSGEMMVILADCDRGGALILEARLKEALSKYGADEGLPREIAFRFSFAVYADEAKSDAELIEKARKAAGNS